MKSGASALQLRSVKLAIFICLLLSSQLIAAESLYDYSISNLLENDQATTRQFNQRFGFNATEFHDNLMSSPELSLEHLDNLSLLSDWHPGKGFFRLSAGLLFQPKNTKSPSYALPILKPNVTSGFMRVGEDGVLPYVGMGLGSNIRQESQIDISFTDSGTGSGNRLDDHGLQPVVSFGVSYSF